MTIHIVYNRSSRLNTNRKANLLRLKRLHNIFLEQKKDCVLELFQDHMASELIHNHQAFIAAENYPGEICWFIIYDDQQKGKFITNESEITTPEDIVGYFRTRDERRLERELMIQQLLETTSLAYIQ